MSHNTLRLIAAIAAVAVLCLVLPASAEDFAFPDTKPGEIAKAFFAAFNANDAEAFKAFTLKYRSTESQAKRPLEERVARTMAMREQVGELEPLLVKEHGDNFIVLIVKSEKVGMYMEHRFDLDAAEPDKLNQMSLKPTGPPELAEKQVGEWSTLSELLMQVRVNAGVPAIAAAVVEDGEVTEVAVVGVREVDTDHAAEASDRFHVGSVTKPMTATMIARLVESGKLDWDDTIAEVLDDVEMHDAYRDVTLELLLQHRSGIDAFAGLSDKEVELELGLSGSPTEQREQFVSRVLVQDPVVTPGSTMTYSNAGYTVVALMAERATGESWEDLMRSQLFEPIGMTSAGFGWPAAQPNQPLGHVREGDAYQVQTDEYDVGVFLAPAGDVCVSIADLARFARAHLQGMTGQGGIVSAETYQRLHAVPGNEPSGYACGWMVTIKETGLVHWHNGSAGTFFALVEVYPQKNCALVVAVNVGLAGAGVVDIVSEEINKRWAGR